MTNYEGLQVRSLNYTLVALFVIFLSGAQGARGGSDGGSLDRLRRAYHEHVTADGATLRSWPGHPDDYSSLTEPLIDYAAERREIAAMYQSVQGHENNWESIKSIHDEYARQAEQELPEGVWQPIPMARLDSMEIAAKPESILEPEALRLHRHILESEYLERIALLPETEPVLPPHTNHTPLDEFEQGSPWNIKGTSGLAMHARIEFRVALANQDEARAIKMLRALRLLMIAQDATGHSFEWAYWAATAADVARMAGDGHLATGFADRLVGEIERFDRVRYLEFRCRYARLDALWYVQDSYERKARQWDKLITRDHSIAALDEASLDALLQGFVLPMEIHFEMAHLVYTMLLDEHCDEGGSGMTCQSWALVETLDPRYSPLKAPYPAFGGIPRTLSEMKCTTHAIPLLVAARAYERDRGSLPANAEQLVPQYLDAISADPFRSQMPLLYKRLQPRNGSESFVVYSVGVNGSDDGGADPEKDHVIYASP